MIELFSANTPNAKKISIMLEEIEYEYKVTKVDLDKGEQFYPSFKKISPFSKIPVIKDFLLDADLSRFTSSLSLLRMGNVSILNALQISSDTISNSYLRSSIKKASNNVKEGESIARSLEKVDVVPPLVIQMIQNGENSGKLEEMLSKLSDYLETRFKNSTKIAMNLLEPLVIIILGVFVALIVLAILLPLIQLNTFTTTL